MANPRSSAAPVSGLAVEKEILEGKVRPLYVVAGEERFWTSRLANLLEPHFPGGRESLDPRQTETGEILFIVSQPSFFGGKLVLVHEAEELLTREETGLRSVAEGNCLFLATKMKAGTLPRLWLRAVQDLGGVVVDAGPPDVKTAVEWVESEVSRLGGRIRRDAAQYMVFLVGRRLLRLETEVQKGVLFAGGKEITKSMLDEFASSDPEASAFALVDAVAEGSAARALAEVADLMVRGFNAPRVFSFLTSQFSLIWKAKELLERGAPVRNAADELGVHPFAAQKAMKQASSWSFSALEEAFECLLRSDEDVKTGKVDPVLACESAVSHLASLVARRRRA